MALGAAFPIAFSLGAAAGPLKSGAPGTPAAAGWRARVLWESDAPVWSILPADVLESKAGLEIVAMDDKGRAPVLFMNNGEALPWLAVMDGRWLGAAAFGDVDPRRPGGELYLAGERGNLYQVTVLPQGGFESRVVWFARQEIHTLILDDMVPGRPGQDLLACTLDGGIHLLFPGEGEKAGDAFTERLIYRDPGRIRDAVVYDFDPGLEGKEILYVSRSGRFVRLGWNKGRLDARVIFEDVEGLARVALGRVFSGGVPVVYTAGDDGRIFRYTRSKEGEWTGRLIYTSPAAARGVAAGRFTGDEKDEAVAVFGYAKDVVLLVRKEGEETFKARTIFTDTDKGHWLEAMNFNCRGLDEILICGYSGRVVLLSTATGS